ncbi:MAG TPA: AAA family ATPase [Herpetosiphonaceae bacterium]|nr:AAA family ATPase [Herpetosiphonaceae bacterium]
MTVTIAIANAKGGVGKTTTALHLAVAFAERGLSTLAIDIDPQGTLTQQLGIATNHDTPTVREVLFDNHRLRDVAVPTRLHLDVAPADLRLADADLGLAQVGGGDLRLRKGMRGLPHEIVVIDCPPALGKLTFNALVAADAYLVPIDSAAFALMGMDMLFRTVEEVREYFNPNLRFLGPVLTLAEPRTLVTRAVSDQLRRAYPETFATMIRRSQKAKEVAFAQETLLDIEPTTTGDDYRTLASEVLGRLGLGALTNDTRVG